MAELLKGRISDTEGLKEVLEIIATFKEISNAVLEISSDTVSGQIGVAWGRFITGATLENSDLKGKKALRRMLRLRDGKFRFVDLELEYIEELRQSLGVDLNRVATVVPELDYKEAHFLFEMGESPDADDEPPPAVAPLIDPMITEEVRKPVLEAEDPEEDERPEVDPSEQTFVDLPAQNPEPAVMQPRLELEEQLPEQTASSVMSSMQPELAQDLALPTSSEPENPYYDPQTTVDAQPLDLVFGGPMPSEWANEAMKVPEPDWSKELPVPEADWPKESFPLQSAEAEWPTDPFSTPAPERQQQPEPAQPEPEPTPQPTAERKLPFLRMQQSQLDDDKRKQKRGNKAKDQLPPPPEHVSGTKQAIPTPTEGLQTAKGPMLAPGVFTAQHHAPSENTPNLRPQPGRQGVPFAVVMLICAVIFVVSCASTVMFGPRAWSGITSVLHLNR